MANQRVFMAQALTTNAQEVGGLASLAFNAAFASVIESAMDGAVGSEDVDKAGLRVGVAMECTDVTKGAAILNAAPGDTVFYGKESGAATYSKYEILTAAASILYSGMNLSFSKNADGRLRCDGLLRFAAGTKKLEDVLAKTAAQSAPTKFTPAPLYRPHTASFDPDGAATAIAPLHTESLTLALAADVIEDFSDTDIGHTAVDVAGWRPLQVTLVHRDSLAVSPGDISAQILDAVKGVLTVSLLGRGGAADKTLTINNLDWTAVDHVHGTGYTDFTLRGVAGWTKRGTPDVNYDLVTTPLFSFA